MVQRLIRSLPYKRLIAGPVSTKLRLVQESFLRLGHPFKYVAIKNVKVYQLRIYSILILIYNILAVARILAHMK